jgi:release factor glutamine methyltransferase
MCGEDSWDALVAEATGHLSEVAGEAARLEAQVMAAHAAGRTRSWLIAHGREIPTDGQRRSFDTLLVRRARGEPLPYITGTKEFFGLSFRVTPAVLIPRPETELLIERFLEIEPHLPPGSIADVGTGSGCILGACLRATQRWGYGTEVAPDALQVAVGNWRALGLEGRAHGVLSDLLACARRQSVAAVLANLPYVVRGDPRVEPGVARHEPPDALYSAGDGLTLIRALVLQAREAMKPAGALILEFGIDQDAAMRDLLAGWREVRLHDDLAGIPRFAVAFRP